MAFTVEISEVGEPEYPLMQTLRETVFSELGHVSQTAIADQLHDRRDLLALIAHLEGNPVGFSAGYRHSGGCFYVNYLAVLRDYRGQGIGRQLLLRQQQFAQARGYHQAQFTTFNRFRDMIRLGLSMGYFPVGVEQHEQTGGDLQIRFARSFQPEKRSATTGSPASSERRIAADDAGALLEAVKQGNSFAGVVRDARDGRLQVIVQLL